MRQIGIIALLVATCLSCAACDSRTPKVVNSQNSPDGRHVIWIMEEIGGLRSGVTSVHVTLKGLKPESKNEVLSSPDCEGATVSWIDDQTVLVSYEYIYGRFNSKLRAIDPNIILLRKNYVKKMGLHPENEMKISCDPF